MTDRVREDLECALVALIRDQISLDPSLEISTDTDLLISGAVDSLGVIQIVDWIEDRVGIEVDPTDVVLEHFQSVACMLAYVDRRLA